MSDSQQAIINDLATRMKGAISTLDHEFKGLRTGRASINFLDSVRVEAYGDHMPVNQLGNINVPEPRMITVQVWDKSVLKAVEKGIVNANLGVNPTIDGDVIRVPLPALTEERRKELVKIAAQIGEKTKVAVRNIRRDGIDQAKKLKNDKIFSEDEERQCGDEIQKLTDKFVKQIDGMVKQKEQDILN
ncbi:MAG: ribosome recycling factor [Pseudomonadota bacterium]